MLVYWQNEELGSCQLQKFWIFGHVPLASECMMTKMVGQSLGPIDEVSGLLNKVTEFALLFLSAPHFPFKPETTSQLVFPNRCQINEAHVLCMLGMRNISRRGNHNVQSYANNQVQSNISYKHSINKKFDYSSKLQAYGHINDNYVHRISREQKIISAELRLYISFLWLL